MGHIRILTVISLAVLLAACVAPRSDLSQIDPELAKREALIQRKMVLESAVEMDIRLVQIARPMWIAAAPLCGKRTSPSFGFYYTNQHEWGGEWLQAANELYGLSDSLQVLYLEPGSPVDQAGMQVGDHLYKIDGWDVPTGEKATELLEAHLEDVAKQLMIGVEPSRQELPPVVFTVLRNGQRRDISATPLISCDYGFHVVQEEGLNAYADGRNVMIHQAMMRFAESDTELAAVMAHELAHNLMGHIEAQETNAAGGMLLDLLAAGLGVNTQGAFMKLAAGAYSQEFEAEADHVGLYIMALANYDMIDAPNFWRRMAIEHPSGIDYGASHPTTPERFLGLENAIALITEQRSAGIDLASQVNIPDLSAWSDAPVHESPKSGEQGRKGAPAASGGDDDENDEESVDAD
jgi:hypothetical protein